MELNGEVLIAAPRSRVWEGLNSPEVLTRCIPGCESMEATSPTERTARVAVKVGPVRARFTGHIRMLDMVEGERCSLQFEGSGGAAGMAKGSSSVALTDEDGGTRLRYTTQASVGGKLGQVGGRMIDAAAKQMADQFFTAFQAELEPAVAQAPDQSLAAADAAADAAAAAEAAVAGAAELPGALGQNGQATAAAEVGAAAATAGAVTAGAATAGPASAAAAPASATAPWPRTVTAAARPVAPPLSGEGTRVLWFALGALSTGFGMWLARVLFA